MVRAVFWRVTANGDFAASKEAAWPDRRSSDFEFKAWGQGSILHLLTCDFRQVT